METRYDTQHLAVLSKQLDKSERTQTEVLRGSDWGFWSQSVLILHSERVLFIQFLLCRLGRACANFFLPRQAVFPLDQSKFTRYL